MRYVRVRVTPTEGVAFHPLNQQLVDEASVTRGPIHRAELLEDGTGIVLAEAQGDRERFEELLANSPYILDYAITGSGSWWYSYTHFEPTDLTERLLRRQRALAVMIEMPIHTAEDGSLEVTFVGDVEGFTRITSSESDDYSIEVLELGKRRSHVDDLFASLTARQREVLEAAVHLGYYQTPREATHKDIATAVDASPSTVGEHLQKIESRVFSEFVLEGQSG